MSQCRKQNRPNKQVCFSQGYFCLFVSRIIVPMLQDPELFYTIIQGSGETNSILHRIAHQGCDKQLAKNGDILYIKEKIVAFDFGDSSFNCTLTQLGGCR